MTRNAGDSLSTFYEAKRLGDFQGQSYAFLSDPATTWHMWGTWCSINPASGQAPLGEPVDAQGRGGGNQGNEPARAGQGVAQTALIDGRPYDRAAAVTEPSPIMDRAAQVKPVFDQKVIDIARRTGVSGQILAAVKGEARAVEKMVLESMPVSGLRDLVLTTIVVQDCSGAHQVVDEILKEFDQVEVKDRTNAGITVPRLKGEPGFLSSGYGDVLVNVSINGMPMEIQVNIPEMLAAKSGEGHQLYEIERSQPEGSVLREELAKAQKELCSAAANASFVRAAATAASNSSFDFFMEKKHASDSGAGSDSGGQYLAGTSSSPISRNGLPSGKTTANAESSKSKNLQPGGNDSGNFTGAPQGQTVVQTSAKGGDTRLARGIGSGGSVDLALLEALEARIQKGMPNMPKVHVLATPATAPEALQQYIVSQGAWSDVEGAMHDGEFYLFGSGLSDLHRAEHVLDEHEATHFGLRAVLGDLLRSAMNMIYVGNAAVRREASKLEARGRLSNAESTEEVIVDIPATELVQLKGWRKLVLKVRDHLAARGYEKLPAQLTAWVDGTLDEQ